MTACCKVPCYENPIYFDETNLRIGAWPSCSRCHRLHGTPNLTYTIPKGIREAFNVYSEVAAKEHFRDGQPLRFVMSPAGLRPLGYKPPQVEMGEVE